METTHALHFADARRHAPAAPGSAALVVTSPPYPMIAMWDAAFSAMSPAARDALRAGDGPRAFENMHRQLDRVWKACFDVLMPGGFVCINIGDATRTLDGQFALYANHARISAALSRLGFTTLPDILWRKPTNAPSKFMGSGMLPAGAYVTYEHEYVLIARKGGRRIFTTSDRARRRQSAYFWEERNRWFSDLWQDLRGTSQALTRADRMRSAAFPLELPYRLICMYSLYGDLIIDPFVGTGTTMLAAAIAGRSSIGVEHDASLQDHIHATLARTVEHGQARIGKRLTDHQGFVAARLASGKEIAHHNDAHDVPVITRQERELLLQAPSHLTYIESDQRWSCRYRRA